MPASNPTFRASQAAASLSGWLGGRAVGRHWPLGRAAAWALLITLAQILVAVVLAGGQTRRIGYERLVVWDGGWYEAIVQSGYYAPAEITPKNYGNVAFFPGYPLLAWCLVKAFGLSTKIALLFASQGACWGFWTYLLLFFERWQLAPRLKALGVLLIVAHPGAFYLIAGYSESLFLMSTLGFLYWTGSARRGAWWLAAAHGIVMTGTRLVGLPVAIFPLCQRCFQVDDPNPEGNPSWTRRYAPALLLGAIASLGAFLFFGYCWLRFGAWDTYMKTGHAGWSITPDYLGFFSYKIFKVHYPSPREWVDAEFFSRLAVPLAVIWFVVLGLVEWRVARVWPDSGWRVRFGLYLVAFLLLYVPVSAQYTRGMTSMIRYALCVQVLLALAVVHLLNRLWPLECRTDRRLVWLFTGWCEIGFFLQILFTHRFVHSKWVA
jgi:hypothetical protein